MKVAGSVRHTSLQLGNTNLGGTLSTVDLLIEVGCFVKKVNNGLNKKGADLYQLVKGGQPY